MEHRKAIKDGSVTRHWQRLRAQKRDARRLEERERKNEGEVNIPPPTTTPPFHPTPPVSPPPQSIWPCQNIKCMLLLLSKRCLRFLKALIRGQVDGNQGIFSCAKRGNNTQLIAQQRGTQLCLHGLHWSDYYTPFLQERSQEGGRSRIWALCTNWLWDLSMGRVQEGEWVDGTGLLLEHLSETFYTLKWWASRQEVLTGSVLGEYAPSNTARLSR